MRKLFQNVVKIFFVVPIILSSVIFTFLLSGCEYSAYQSNVESTYEIDEEQNLKIYSNAKEIATIPYKSISEKPDYADEKIAKVGTLENLISLFNSMGLFYLDSIEQVTPTSGRVYRENGADTKTAVPQEEPKIAIEEAMDAGAMSDSVSNAGHSETNTQVKGVDEADIIKTDGTYIYVVFNNKLTIFDTKDATKIVGSIDLQTIQNISINDIYIVGDILVLNGNRYEYLNSDGDVILYESANGKETRIYPYANKNFTTFMVYDISDRSKPSLIRTVEAEGDAISTRLIGTTIYFVTNKWMHAMLYNEVRDFDLLPSYKDTALTNELTVIDPSKIHYFPESNDTQYMIVGAFDVTKNDPLVPQAYLGSGSTIYMNTNSLYVTKTTYHYNNMNMKDANIDVIGNSFRSPIQTEIYRFAINETTLDYVGCGSVNGYIINQYSMDEYKGILRIATGEYSIGNGVTTIDIQTMETVGFISGLAINENIYSVRFMGDIGYMVTYRQVDPLFVFDLSNPEKPIKTGELKIPGFSQYLHPVGKNYLVGFGRNTVELYYMDDKGNQVSSGQVRDLGFKLSLFDVSDLYNPKEVFVKNYPENSYSDASYNPRSIMVDATRNIFAFPISQPDTNKSEYDYGQGGTVVQIDEEIGFITLADISLDGYAYNARFCYVKDRLYFFSQNEVVIYSYPDCKFIEKMAY